MLCSTRRVPPPLPPPPRECKQKHQNRPRKLPRGCEQGKSHCPSVIGLPVYRTHTLSLPLSVFSTALASSRVDVDRGSPTVSSHCPSVSGVKGGSHVDADRGSPTVGGHCPSMSGVKGGSHVDADKGSPTVGGHCPFVSRVKGGFNLPLLYVIGRKIGNN